jgi:hypothetical protein
VAVWASGIPATCLRIVAEFDPGHALATLYFCKAILQPPELYATNGAFMMPKIHRRDLSHGQGLKFGE